ncbi:MAG: hypothetical protein SNJ55_08490 [Chloroherpetonaceae bacterium]
MSTLIFRRFSRLPFLLFIVIGAACRIVAQESPQKGTSLPLC